MRSREVQADATLFPADDWLQLTSDVRASRLSRLATRARQAETQNRLVAKGLQRLLVSEVLLRRAPVTLFEADALRTEQAEAARCIANLAFQQSNKPAVVEAGGLDALEGLLSAELQCARAGAPLGDAAAALILEATAAIANLASSSEVRVRCAEATCPVPVLLLEVIELWRGARANRRRRRSGVVTAPGTGPSLYSAASEATRGLKNLACDPITHARLLGAGALESLQQAPPPPPPALPPPPMPPPLPLPPPPPSPRNASLSSTAHLPRTAPPRPHPPLPLARPSASTMCAPQHRLLTAASPPCACAPCQARSLHAQVLADEPPQPTGAADTSADALRREEGAEEPATSWCQADDDAVPSPHSIA
jgi:hypothetical protein